MSLNKICELRIEEYTRALAWAKVNEEKLAVFGDKVQLIGTTQIDFNLLTRAEVLSAIKMWPGKWSKSTQHGRMDYELVVDGFVLRCWNAELPPSCHIVKEEVIVPEHVEPEHTEMRQVVKCTGGHDLPASAGEPQ